jgi:outer membrane protein TolC
VTPAQRITVEVLFTLARSAGVLDAEGADVLLAEAQQATVEAAYAPRITADLRGSASPGTLARLPGTDAFVNAQKDVHGFSAQARYGLMVTAEQGLFDFGRTPLRRQAAVRAHEAAVGGVTAARAELHRTLASLFFAWAARVAMADAAEEDLAAASAAAARSGRRIAEGNLSGSVRTLAEEETDRAAMALSKARAAAAEARLALERVLGPLPAGAVPDPTGASPPDPQGDAILSALHARHGAAVAEARAAAATNRPVVGAAASLGVRGVDEHVFPSWEVGLGMKAQLWDASASAATRAAKAKARRLEAQIAREEREALARAQAAQAALPAAESRVEIAGRLIAHAERAASDVEKREAAGDATADEVERAKADLRRARLERRLAAIEVARAQFDARP